ncbi:hypothetical protein SAMN02910384_02777 [Pseudobutyrivibrio sp. ACV-2]|uniref:hypothetical protein n=1 Tax=Pseudobutyrivibrio sp. ACV-2 TaxID=1520801 RepID=UPI00089C3D0F|nr:hypothetical protein [Pseudobutyrivibrio sp. ACV-2]SEA93483.1 hypothetical protein SAMN02910384_02777 [Pseudobutyrivibrio sp. ACV-2]
MENELEFLKAIPKAIQLILSKKNMTIDELAQKGNSSVEDINALMRLEIDKVPSDIYDKIAIGFDINKQYLIMITNCIATGDSILQKQLLQFIDRSADGQLRVIQALTDLSERWQDGEDNFHFSLS